MIAKIHLDSLSKEYQKKLSERKLTYETIFELAVSISQKYMLQKRLIIRIGLISTVMICAMGIMGIFSPAAAKGNPTIILLSCVVAYFLDLCILFFLYFIAITRIPRQFSSCLKKGYPELSMAFGYETIVSGSLSSSSCQLPFSLMIEDIFNLQGCNDVIVTGFVHGLIRKNCSVYLLSKDSSPAKHLVSIVTRIEIAPGTTACEVADCRAALQLQNGKKLNLRRGMYLYRQDPFIH